MLRRGVSSLKRPKGGSVLLNYISSATVGKLKETSPGTTRRERVLGGGRTERLGVSSPRRGEDRERKVRTKPRMESLRSKPPGKSSFRS